MNILIICAFVHHVAAFSFAALLYEFLTIRPKLADYEVKKLKIVGIIQLVSAVLVLVVGFQRLILEKGLSYYMKNAAFHGKITLFFIIFAASIYVTIKFFDWSNRLVDQDAASPSMLDLEPNQVKRVKLALRIQKVGILLIIYCAVLMSKGAGSF